MRKSTMKSITRKRTRQRITARLRDSAKRNFPRFLHGWSKPSMKRLKREPRRIHTWAAQYSTTKVMGGTATFMRLFTRIATKKRMTPKIT